MLKTLIAATAASLLVVGTPVFAEEKMDHGGHGQMDHSGHGQMQAVDVKPGTEAAGVGVLNSVDADKGMVNLTHEPMPALGWPTMTMDLPVTNQVDLSAVKPGDKIDFTLKLGRDKQYRVMDMKPAQ